MPGFGDPRRTSTCSASRRPRTAATAPAASSPATARATGCSRPSTGRDSRTSPRHCTRTTASSCAARSSPPPSGARRPRTGPLPSERDNCLPYAAEELELMPNVRVIVCLGGFAWDAALRLDPPPAARGRSSDTWPSSSCRAGASCSAPTTRASRTPSPADLTEEMTDAVFLETRTSEPPARYAERFRAFSRPTGNLHSRSP